MKLIKKTVEMNEETFTPEMEVTLRLDLDALMDQITIDQNAYAKLGKQLTDLVSGEEPK